MAEFTLGLIGTGIIAGSHARALRLLPHIRLIGVCEPDAAKRARRMRELELTCPGYDEPGPLLSARPDVVVICAPHGLHAQLAIEALRAGCHVLVEKPMAVSAADCAAMIAAARHCGKRIVVSEQLSFAPGPVLTGRKFQAGLLGRFLMAHSSSAGFYFKPTRPAWFLDPALSGGGMFMNLGVHRLAAVRAALPGLAPRSVSASVPRHPAYPVEGCGSVLVRYRDGGAAHYQYLGYYPSVQGIGESYMAFEEGLVTWDQTTWRIMSRAGTEHTEALPPPQDGFIPVYENVGRAVRGEPYAPPPETYAEDIAIVEAAYASAREGREIALPPTAS